MVSTPAWTRRVRVAIGACLGGALVASFVPRPLVAAPAHSVALAGEINLVDSFGGSLSAVALDGAFVFLAAGRRLHIHDLRRERGDTLVGVSEPQRLPVQHIEPMAEHLVLLTGVLNSVSELVVLDRRDPSAPSVVGRLALRRYAHGLAVHAGAAWIAQGASGVIRVDVNDPSAPRTVGAWRPAAPEGFQAFGVVDMVDVGTAVLALHGPVPTGGQAIVARQLTALSYEPGAGIVERSTITVACPRRGWSGATGAFACSDNAHATVWDFADSRVPSISASPALPRGALASGVHLVDGDLAVVTKDPVHITGFDLANRARTTGEVSLRLGDWDSPAFQDSDGRHVLVANDTAFAVVPTVPKPVVVRPYEVPHVRYRRVSKASDGIWVIDNTGRLELRGADGDLRNDDAATVPLLDIFDRPEGIYAIETTRGPLQLRPQADGTLSPGKPVGPRPSAWGGSDVQPSQLRWIAGSPELLVTGTDSRFAGAVRVGPSELAWGGFSASNPISGASVIVEGRRIVYVSSPDASIKSIQFGPGGAAQRIALPNLVWTTPARARPVAIAGRPERFAVGDSGGTLSGIDASGIDPIVAWTMDLPGPVVSMAMDGDTLWASWSALAGVTRGGAPVPITGAVGLTALRLYRDGADVIGTTYIEGPPHDLHADVSGAAKLEDGAVLRFAIEGEPEAEPTASPIVTEPATSMPPSTPTVRPAGSTTPDSAITATVTPPPSSTRIPTPRPSHSISLPWLLDDA